MAWIHTIDPDTAEGPIAVEYQKAIKRAGRVFGIIRLMSLNPPALKASMQQYLAVMFGNSELTRLQRELIATVVSRTNECFY